MLKRHMDSFKICLKVYTTLKITITIIFRTSLILFLKFKCLHSLNLPPICFFLLGAYDIRQDPSSAQRVDLKFEFLILLLTELPLLEFENGLAGYFSLL